MKKTILFTLSLLLIGLMMGCPSRVNLGPSFHRLHMVDGEERLIKLQPITADIFNEAKDSFEKSTAEDAGEFNYEDQFGDQYIIYEYVKGTDFDPAAMLDDLLNDYNVVAIDYKQDYVEPLAERDYEIISENIMLTSFYDIWDEGEDANHDGVVDDEDQAYYDDYKTDEDGNYVYDQSKIVLVEVVLQVGNVLTFSLTVEDEDGAKASIDGVILIVDSQED